MTIPIQRLLNQLIFDIDLQTSTIGSKAKDILTEMKKEFYKLQKSNDEDKQTNMIKIFMGGTILAMRVDDDKYRRSSQSTYFYPVDSYNVLAQGIKPRMTDIESMYELGDAILSRSSISEFFSGKIFTATGKLFNTEKPSPFFPRLAQHAQGIDLLVDFCSRHADALETAEFEEDEDLGFTFDTGIDDIKDIIKKEGLDDSFQPFQSPVSTGLGEEKRERFSRQRSSFFPPTLRDNPLDDEDEDDLLDKWERRPSNACSGTTMRVLSYFMEAIGVTAVVVAFILFNLGTLGQLMTLGGGLACLYGGIQCRPSDDSYRFS